MKKQITPTCRYGHGNLVCIANLENKPEKWVAPIVENGLLNLGRGYTFYIYQCPSCTYLELHDPKDDI